MEESVNEHYRRLLRLPEPWRVELVEEDLVGERVVACVKWPENTPVACPQCGKACGIYDRLAERTWRHLSVMQYLLELRRAALRMPGAWGEDDRGAVGGARLALYFPL